MIVDVSGVFTSAFTRIVGRRVRTNFGAAEAGHPVALDRRMSHEGNVAPPQEAHDGQDYTFTGYGTRAHRIGVDHA
ncbi:hypothetical protein ACFQ06_00110 [Tessaracoccus lubricantis]